MPSPTARKKPSGPAAWDAAETDSPVSEPSRRLPSGGGLEAVARKHHQDLARPEALRLLAHPPTEQGTRTGREPDRIASRPRAGRRRTAQDGQSDKTRGLPRRSRGRRARRTEDHRHPAGHPPLGRSSGPGPGPGSPGFEGRDRRVVTLPVQARRPARGGARRRDRQRPRHGPGPPRAAPEDGACPSRAPGPGAGRESRETARSPGSSPAGGCPRSAPGPPRSRRRRARSRVPVGPGMKR